MTAVVPAHDLPSSVVPTDDLPSSPQQPQRTSSGAVPSDDLPGGSAPALPTFKSPAKTVAKPPANPTGQASPVTPTHQQTRAAEGEPPNMVHAIGAAFSNLGHQANNVLAEGQARLKESAADPLGAANNVEQTPARFMATLLNHGIHMATLKDAFGNAFDPGAGNDEVDRLNQSITAHMPKTDNPIGKFAEGLAASFVSDPVTYLPIVGWLGKTAAAAKTLETMSDAAKAVAGPRAVGHIGRAAKQMRGVQATMTGKLAETLKPVFGGRPELDPLLEPHAKAAHLGFEHREISRMQGELGESDQHLLEQNKAALKSVKPTATKDVTAPDGTVIHPTKTANTFGDPKAGGGTKGYELPEPIKQRYLQEPWRYGTPEMRQQAEALGYKPTAADKPWTAKPEGLLDYNLRQDYQYLGNVSDMSASPAFKKYGGKNLGEATFERERTGNYKGLDADQFDRVAARLRMGRDQIRRGRAQAATADYVKQFGGWKGPVKDEPLPGGATKQVPDGIDKLTTDPVRIGGPGRWLSSMAGRAVQGSVFPHAINNVGTLSFLKSPIGVGRAIGYMAKDAKTGGKALSDVQLKRIQDIGAMVDYGHQPAGTVWSKILSGGELGEKALAGSQKLLTKMEMSYRQGLLDELDRTMGPSKTLKDEMAKGQAIRDAVVDYRNIPLIAAFMEAAGAPFTPFLAGLTHAVGKAVMKHPERVAAVQKVENHAQNDLGYTIPNPVNTFEKNFDLPNLAATRGGIPGQIGQFLASPFIDSPLESAGGEVEKFAGPWLSQVPGMFNLPYPDRGVDPGTFDPTQGLVHFLTGAYPYNGPAGAYQTKEIERMKGKAEE